jgi:N-sulfoglucosamine sulfohydrolase
LAWLFATATASAAPRNVLLLISDNQDFGDVGFNGHPVVKTPNLDRLAARGVNFTHAFATTASCGPSRAVIYTGLLTHANGQYGHSHSYHNQSLRPEVTTVFGMLREAGYATALIGKDHVVTRDDARLHAEYRPQGSPRDLKQMAQQAEEFLNQSRDKPFLLTIGLHDPHPTSRAGWGFSPEQRLPSTPLYDPADAVIPYYLHDRPEVREGLAGYYEQISQMDTGVGMMLDVLEKSGRAADTLVIFFSDHGSSEPGAMGNLYEPGVHVPLVVYDPRLNQQGAANSAMISLADVTPTILDWAGVKPPYPLHGRSFLPVLGNQRAEGWDEVVLDHIMHEVTQYYPMRGLRNRRYKLIWNIAWRLQYELPIDTLHRRTWTETIRRGDERLGPRLVDKFLFRDEVELYDLEKDPAEVENLASNPAHAEIKQRMLARLHQRLTETGDPWLLRHAVPGVAAAE